MTIVFLRLQRAIEPIALLTKPLADLLSVIDERSRNDYLLGEFISAVSGTLSRNDIFDPVDFGLDILGITRFKFLDQCGLEYFERRDWLQTTYSRNNRR